MARLTDIMKEEDPCWNGYKQIGMKKKGSKEVPNCVPESVNEEESPEEILKGLNEMAMGNLERIEDYAEMISDRMEQGQQLESWMFSEITQALNGLNSVHNAMDGADGIKEAELPKAMIPGPIKAKLTQAIDKIKDTNLSYTQKLQVISKIIDSLGIDKKELTKISTRLKGTLESLNEITLASVVKKSDNFKEFVKQFYKEYKDFPKDRDTIKWLSGIYTDIKGGAKTQSISEETNEDLRAWFGKGKTGSSGGGGWDRYGSDGQKLGKCGDGDDGDAYAACLSKEKAAKLGPEGRAAFVRRKRADQKKSGDTKKGGEKTKGQKPTFSKTGA